MLVATALATTESLGPDYVAAAVVYAREAVADVRGKRFGKWIKRAAVRFLADLQRAKSKDCAFTFDAWHANDACDFIEKLPHVEGIWATPTIVLHRSHAFFVVQLFGFRQRDTGLRRYTSALFAVARKNAKALALDTPIPTPSGWKAMGDLLPGDAVFGADGRPCRVTDVSPVYVDHDCYSLRFSNGEQVTADAGHRWLTTACVDNVAGKRVGNGQTRTRVRTTEEIAATLRCGARGDTNHSVLMPAPIECAAAKLPVAPYTLGAWLGDGHSASARITFSRDDSEILSRIGADGWPVREMHRNGSKASTYVISDGDRKQSARNKSLAATLRGLGVLNNKHIPAIYLRASKAQRLALLQGLMDTDGTVSKNGRVLSFTSISEKLTEGVGELLASFGIKYSWRRDAMVCNGRPVPGTAHMLQFMAFRDEIEVFGLRRKLDRMRVRMDCDISPRSQSVQIVEAERVVSVPVRCITVDSPDSLFLFGRTMLPTHNSTLSAAIMLYCQCCEQEPGAQLVSAATTGSQARIVWGVAKRMAEKTADLREAFGLECFANSIARMETGASFKPINAKASTQDGLNLSHTALDEIHAHKTADLLNVLQSAAGARQCPLFLFTTTEGYANPGPWADIRRFVWQMLEGVYGTTADHFLALYFAVDERIGRKGNPDFRAADDDFDEESWKKANPLWDANPHLLPAIRKEAIEARHMPSKIAEFRIKRLNRQSAAAEAWIDLGKWQLCSGPVDLDWLAQFPCYGGLDLASTRDLCSFRLVWNVDGLIYTWGMRWVPSAAVTQRTERGTVPYAAWVEAGLIKQTDGDVADYEIVEADIKAICERFNVVGIAYDQWNAADLVNRLVAAELPMIKFIQGPKSYHPAMQALELAYIGGNLVHGEDPVLGWCAANLVPRRDANLNMAPDKKRSADKIDDMSALCMAIGISLVQTESGDMAGFFANPVIG